MTKNTATETVTLSNLNTTTRPAKARKATVTAWHVVRKGTVRKALAKDIRALERIRTAIEKAASQISTVAVDVRGDTHNQIADMLYKMGINVSVIDADISEKANALAKTFIK
jgi:translation initiation factor 1 (eIF-1/SUI1)